MQFNINHTVKVKLTPHGKNLYLQYYAAMGIDVHLPSEDEEGYSEFQLWRLMSIFREHVFCGCELPFDATILIDDKHHM